MARITCRLSLLRNRKDGEFMRQSILRRFVFSILIPFFLAFLLPSLACLSLFGRSVSEIEKNSERGQAALVNNLSQNLENLLTDIENEMNLWSMQAQNIHSTHYSQRLESSLISSQFQLQITLKAITNPLLNSGYIFLFSEDQVITPFISGNTLNYFYDSFFSYDDMTLTEFIDHFRYQYYETSFIPDVRITRNKVTYNVPVFVQSVPNDPHQRSNGVIIFTLDTNYVDELLWDSVPNGGSISLVYQKDGEPFLLSQALSSDAESPSVEQIFSRFSEIPESAISYQTINGHEFYVYKQAVGGDGLYAVLLQPSEIALESTRSITWILIGEGIAIVLFLILFAFGYTRRSVSMIRSVVDAFSSVDLGESGKIKDVFTYIQRAASKTLRQNEQLHLHLEKQRIVMEEAFLRRLISGDFLYESDVIQEQEELEFLVNYSRYLVLLCNLGGNQPPDLEKLSDSKWLIRRRLSEQFPDCLQMLNYDVSSLVCIIGTDSEPDVVRKQVSDVFSEIGCPLPLFVSGGSPVRSLYDVSQAYREARYVQNNLSSPGQEVVWYQEVYRSAPILQIQPGLYAEQSLLNQIMVGNTYEVERILANIQDSVSGPESSPKALKCLSYELYRMAAHILTANSAGEEELMELSRRFDSVFLDNGNFGEYFSWIRDLCVRYSEENKTCKKGKNDELLEKITDYIQENYADPQLCVAVIAQHCSISPKYLSQLFKEQKNENISSYIENLRIEKSCLLLQNTDQSINEIALAVGYTNVHTFRTAFKRCKFVTPREFRDAISQK